MYQILSLHLLQQRFDQFRTNYPLKHRQKWIWKIKSAEVICCKYLLWLLNNSSTEAKSEDPDQTAPVGAAWSGSTLFEKKSSTKIRQTTFVVIGTLRVNLTPFLVNQSSRWERFIDGFILRNNPIVCLFDGNETTQPETIRSSSAHHTLSHKNLDLQQFYKVNINVGSSFEQTLSGSYPQCYRYQDPRWFANFFD